MKLTKYIARKWEQSDLKEPVSIIFIILNVAYLTLLLDLSVDDLTRREESALAFLQALFPYWLGMWLAIAAWNKSAILAFCDNKLKSLKEDYDKFEE